MERLLKIYRKNERVVIGLMSGTSVDGIDAALVRISGRGTETKIDVVCFENYPYPEIIREKIFRLFNPETSAVDEICHMNFLLGELFAEAAIRVVKKAGMTLDQIDLIASHGQTIYHIPQHKYECGYYIRSTMQIGEAAVIAERTKVVTVSNFRSRDMAAGGQGAPLVPYTEYILYRKKDMSVGLQNIGGIANITVLPKNCSLSQVIAFDNGPGNMVIDGVVYALTEGHLTFDNDGNMAGKGKVHEGILSELLEDPYFMKKPPKTTGREYFGKSYTDRLLHMCRQKGMNPFDIVATATALTARSIADSYKKFIIAENGLDEVIIGGGGSYNSVLIRMLKNELQDHRINVITQEEMGYSSDAKEAVAFAVLGNEALWGNSNNVPTATGAGHSVILGDITL